MLKSKLPLELTVGEGDGHMCLSEIVGIFLRLVTVSQRFSILAIFPFLCYNCYNKKSNYA